MLLVIVTQSECRYFYVLAIVTIKIYGYAVRNCKNVLYVIYSFQTAKVFHYRLQKSFLNFALANFQYQFTVFSDPANKELLQGLISEIWLEPVNIKNCQYYINIVRVGRGDK